MRTSLVGVAAALLLVACVVDNEPAPYASAGGATPTGTGGTTGDGSSTPSASPILVDVDDGATMTAQPGQGVGVFTEYVSGGHWHVWWTCDTSQTGESCPMSVNVTLAKGQVSNPVADVNSTAAPVVSENGSSVAATTVTTTGMDGMTFDTDAGAIITLSATIGGAYDGSFLFFVQAGSIDGSYKGTITDPLMLEGASP